MKYRSDLEISPWQQGQVARQSNTRGLHRSPGAQKGIGRNNVKITSSDCQNIA